VKRLALLLLLALPAPASGAGLETVIQDDRLLLHQPREEVARAMAEIRALGADRVRLTANWSSLAPQPDELKKPEGLDLADPAAYETARWQRLDDAVRLARENGLGVNIDVGFWAPVWATADQGGPRARTAVDPAAYADFTVAVVRRYGGAFSPPLPTGPPPPPSNDEQELDRVLGGTPVAQQQREPEPAKPPPPAPLPRVDRFTLWNEPNHHALLMPQWTADGKRPASPAIYRAMVMAAYPAAKGARPDAAILIGNTSSSGGATGGGSGPVAPLHFLRELACVDERLRPRTDGDCATFTTLPGDGWAHHPYAQNKRPDVVSRGRRSDDVLVGDLPRLARTLDALAATGRIGPAVRDIHVTEFGYETEALGDRPGVGQEQQALWLSWGKRVARKVPNVKGWAQFLLRDQPPAAERVSESLRRPFGQFWTGLLNSDGREKLAAQTFRAGLVAERRGQRRLTLWGRLRLQPGPHRVRIERSILGRRWRLVTAFTIDGRDEFARSSRYLRGARYRLSVDGVRGLTVSPVVHPSKKVRPRGKRLNSRPRTADQ
jgi:hypothetical protein